jgi:uncharacterized membrane protein
MWEKLAGIVMILLGCWQFVAGVRQFKQVKHHGDKNTSPFIMYANFYGFFFGALLLILGIAILTGAFD